MRSLLIVISLLISSPAHAQLEIGEKKILVMILSNPGDSPIVDKLTTSNEMSRISNEIRSASGDLSWFNFDVTEPFTAPYSYTNCNIIGSLEAYGWNGAGSQGYNVFNYSFYVYIIPYTNACNGIAGITIGNNVILNGNLWSLYHELGHAVYQRSHADGIRCEVGVPLGNSCRVTNQTNPFDVMGSGTESFNSRSQYYLSWLSGAQSYTEVTSSGSYLIEDFDNDGPSLAAKALRIQTPGRTGRAFWVESRSGIPVVLWEFGSQELLIHDFSGIDIETGIAFSFHPGTIERSLIVEVFIPGNNQIAPPGSVRIM